MEDQRVIHGRIITPEEMGDIRELLCGHPNWSRRRLSGEVCARWNWRNAKGQLRDIACRTILLRLHRAGEIVLPQARHTGNNERRYRRIAECAHDTTAIEGLVGAITPLTLIAPRPSTPEDRLFIGLLQRYHYLGFKPIPGENMRYLAMAANGRPVACLLFAAAAWKVAARDRFIGWSAIARETHLSWVTNNTRFLIPPWVKVKSLASHVLARVSRRIAADWQQKYGHPIHLLETFVERPRYRGVCYRAANWICVGSTVGRTRNDRHTRIQVPIKDVYVYPLHRQFRRELGS